jgi:hypothetical protein
VKLIPESHRSSLVSSFVGGARSRWIVVALALLGLTLLRFIFPVLRGEVVMMRRDGLVYYFLIKMLVGQMLAQGMMPLWNPYLFGGLPLLASIEPGVLYPLNWISALLPPIAAMNFTVIGSYHLALTGGYLFGRRLGLPVTGALVLATGFAWGGFMLSQMDLTHYVAALAWLPWLLLALEALYQNCLPGAAPGAAWRWVTLGTLFIALQTFAGAPQASFQMLLVGLPYALFSLMLRERAARWRFLLTGSVMAASGALLSAIQLLPTLELRAQGERAQIAYGFFASWSMPWRQLLALVFPFFFGPQWRSFYQSPLKDEAWQVTLCHGYIGMAGLLLAAVAVIGSLKRTSFSESRCAPEWQHRPALRPESWRRMVWFWLAMAVIGLLCAAGDKLPFGAHHLLYRVPVYNFFRCPYRHLFEYSFAASVLAGLGVSYLTLAAGEAVKRILACSCGLIALLAMLAATAYQLSPRLFPASAGAVSRLTDREAMIPLVCLLLSIGAVWFYRRQARLLSGLLLFSVLTVDLMLMGMGFEWHIPARQVREFYADDPPAAAYLKAREPDLSAFRILSYSLVKYPVGYRELMYQNLPLARGFQTISGYDPLRPDREAEVAGELDFEGTVRDASLLDPQHQGCNLLNVKYLLRQELLHDSSKAAETAADFVRYAGVPFRPGSLNLRLEKENRHALEARNFPATELAVISTMTHSTHLPDGAVAGRVKIHLRDGRIIERKMQAGRDTSEWAWDRPDVRAAVRHERAPIAFSLSSDEGFPVHRYLARFGFPRAEVDYVEFESVPVNAELIIFGATLTDEAGRARALELTRLAPERWKRLASFGTLAVYENLKALPRAWFVEEVKALQSAEVIRAIKTGSLPDGSAFDSGRTALLESEAAAIQPGSPSERPRDAQARVIRFEPNRIEVETSASQPAFLVLSEMFYPGWQAWLDGRQMKVERVDYVLRGVAVPAGKHRLEFVFRPASLRRGALCAVFGALILLAGAVLIRFRKKRPVHKTGSSAAGVT